jgi:hypothetical protein
MSWPEQVFTWFVIRVTRRVIYVEQDLLTLLLKISLKIPKGVYIKKEGIAKVNEGVSI